MPLALERHFHPGLAAWWRGTGPSGEDAGTSDAMVTGRESRRRGLLLTGIALLGAIWGALVAVAGLNALYLCVSLIGCAFIARDFRIGVVLLIVLMPISASYFFPHAMLGITGLNPLNLLLVGTLGSFLFQGLFDGSLRGFVPRPLFWMYIVPMLIGGAMGVGHVSEIASVYHIMEPELIAFYNATGYIRDMVVKPLFLVLFALLVAAAVMRSNKPDKLLIPTMISIALAALMVILFVAQSGVSLGQLASSEAREFMAHKIGLHANDLGRLFTIAYALLLFSWVALRHVGYRILVAACMALAVIALMLTFSRGAFVGFIGVNVLFLIWQRSIKTLIGFVLLAAIALLVLPAEVYDRATVGMGQGVNAISAGRVETLWLPLLPEVVRSPIYGSGLGSMMWSETMHSGGGVSVLQATHPHNAYLQALLDLGSVGLLVLCGYFVHVWRGFRTLYRDAQLTPVMRGFFQGAAAGMLSLAVANLSDGSLLPRPEQVFLWLAIGMMYGLLRKRLAK